MSRTLLAGLKSARPVLKLLLLAAMIALCALPPLYLNDPAAWLPLLSLLAALGCSAVYLLLLRFTLVCSGSAGRSLCQRGDTIPLTVATGNRGPFACPRLEGTLELSDLAGTVVSQEPVAAMLPAFSKKAVSLSFSLSHVGCYRARLTGLRAYSLFGLLSIRLPDAPAEEIVCAPREWKLPSPAYSPLPAEENNQRTASPDEGYDYTGVREYAPGDPMKNIHWKLSAHQPAAGHAPYLTRLLDRPGSPGVSILLDLRFSGQRPDEILSQLDALTECAWGLCQAAVSDGFEAEICFFDRDGVLRRLSPSLGDSRQNLAALLPPVLDRPEPSLDRLLNLILSNHCKTNLVLCSARADRETIFQLEETRSHRRIPFLYRVVTRTEEKSLGALPVDCVSFHSAAQLVKGVRA